MSEAAGHRSKAAGGVCVVAACCWALAGFLFGWEGFVTYDANTGSGAPPDPAFSLLSVLLGVSYSFGPLLLIVLGLVYLSWGGRSGSRWLAGWTVIMAACVMTNILTLLWANSLWPMGWVASRLDFLAIMAAHLLVGVAMVVAVLLASRRIRPAREPGVLPSLGLGLAIMGMGAAGFVITGHVYYILFMGWFLAAFHIGIAITTRFRRQEASSSGVI